MRKLFKIANQIKAKFFPRWDGDPAAFYPNSDNPQENEQSAAEWWDAIGGPSEDAGTDEDLKIDIQQPLISKTLPSPLPDTIPSPAPLMQFSKKELILMDNGLAALENYINNAVQKDKGSLPSHELLIDEVRRLKLKLLRLQETVGHEPKQQ